MDAAIVMEALSTEAKENGEEFLLDLVERIKTHDPDAFAELVGLFQKKIFSFAYQFFHNREDALEIVQETFMRVYEKIETYRPEHSLQSWIYRLAHNLCVDYYRKFEKKRKLVDSLENVPGRQLTSGDDSEAAWKSQRTAEAIERAVETLSMKQKEVFILKYRQGLKLQQVADAMAISIGTVKALNHRAIQRIRRVVGPVPGGQHENVS